MYKFLSAICLSLTSSGLLAAPESVPSAQDVLQCASENAPEQSFSQGAEFIVSERQGGAERRISAAFAGLSTAKGLMLNIGVKSPADVAGTVILLKRNEAGDEQLKLYLPALRRVRTVSGSMANQGIMGTDFSYRDMREVYGVFRKGEATYVEKTQLGERWAHRLDITPEEEGPVVYSRIVGYFDAESCVPLQIEFEAQEGQVSKRLTGDYASLYDLDGKSLLMQYTMHDLNADRQTKLTLGRPHFDEKIRRTAFVSGSFYNYHNRVEVPDTQD